MNLSELSPKRLRVLTRLVGRQVIHHGMPVAAGVATGLAYSKGYKMTENAPETRAEMRERIGRSVGLAVVGHQAFKAASVYPGLRRSLAKHGRRQLIGDVRRLEAAVGNVSPTMTAEHVAGRLMQVGLPERGRTQAIMHPLKQWRAGRILKARDNRYKAEFRAAGIQI